jgi:integrase
MSKARTIKTSKTPWNKGAVVCRKLPLTFEEIRAIRKYLKTSKRIKELALFNLAIDSSLHVGDLLELRVRDVAPGGQVTERAKVTQQKTKKRIEFELSKPARDALSVWILQEELSPKQFLFPSRIHGSPHLSARQYGRIVDQWVTSIGLDRSDYGAESIRRTKATLTYMRTKDLQAAQLLLRHTRIRSTVRFLGIETGDV